VIAMTALPLSTSRRGMSLVELLVVISILGLLAVAVIPNLSNTGDRRKVREAARTLSSFIAAGQSRAIGSRGGAGVWIDILPTATSNKLGTNIFTAIDVAYADVHDPYSGDSPSAKITSLSVSSGSTATATFSGGCNPPSLTGNRIRLAGSRNWFDFEPATRTLSFRDSVSQTNVNTVWPKAAAGLAYEIMGPPTRSPNNSLTLGNGVAIDLYHSTLNSTVSGSLQSLVGIGSFQIMFAPTGRPTALVVGTTRYEINDPIFLLVTSIESIENSEDLAPTVGYWISLDPRSGVPKVAEVAAGVNLLAQQSLIRGANAAYGR